MDVHPSGDLMRESTCSTPFGITDEWTPADRGRTPPSAASAQRLSASRMNGPGSPVFIMTANTCSTPFGITDEWTLHRRLPHRLGERAQRLSASRMNGHGAGQIRDIGLLCSTPFGITDEWTGEERGTIEDVLEVLNAFRHHG